MPSYLPSCFYFLFLFDTGSQVDWASHKLTSSQEFLTLPPPPKCWDYKWLPPHIRKPVLNKFLGTGKMTQIKSTYYSHRGPNFCFVF